MTKPRPPAAGTVELQPDSALAHGNLGAVLADRDRFEEATACYERALEIDPRSAETHRSLAVLSLRQNKLEAALASCQRALAIDPDSAERILLMPRRC